MKIKATTLAVGLALGFAGGAANALTYYPITQFQDDNVEYVIDVDGDGEFSIGDRLRSVVEFADVANLAGLGSYSVASTGQELKGISEIQLIDIINNTFIFGPSTAFTAIYGAGALAAVYLDGIPSSGAGNFNLVGNTDCVSIADCEAKAISGSLLMTLGFGDADDYWYADLTTAGLIGAGDIDSIANLAGSTIIATANYALSMLVNNTGLTLVQQESDACSILPFLYGTACDDGLNDVIGSGTVFGGAGLTNGYQARSDFDYQFAVVPEPTTVALMGLGLLGLGFSARRRSHAKQDRT